MYIHRSDLIVISTKRYTYRSASLEIPSKIQYIYPDFKKERRKKVQEILMPVKWIFLEKSDLRWDSPRVPSTLMLTYT